MFCDRSGVGASKVDPPRRASKLGRPTAVLAFLIAVFSLSLAFVPPRLGAGTRAVSAFDGARAFSYLRTQCDFGPRVPGAKAHDQARDYLKKELARYADEVREQTFSVQLGQKKLELSNIVAFIYPADAKPLSDKSSYRWAMICAHWDSRPTADMDPDPARRKQPVLGANDGASGVAVILEMARVLAAHRPARGVMLVLFDGEDYGPNVDQMFLGSDYFARHLPSPKPEWGVLLDMVGDKYLQIPIEGNSQERAPQVVERVWRAAQTVGSSAFIKRVGSWVTDDHIPLLEAGVPCIDVIDFSYPAWHTSADTPDKCAPESLAAVGRTIIQALADK